jgi:ABC-type Fe3+ transport system permease subunit
VGDAHPAAFDIAVAHVENGGMSLAVRFFRALGWAWLLVALGPPVLLVVVTLWRGPPNWDAVALSPRLTTIYLRTVVVALGATTFALLAALPAAFALLHARRPLTRGCLYGLCILPLLTPPSAFGYAWMLLGTQPHALGRALGALGFNSEPAAPLRAAVALGNWLWPILALTLTAAYRQSGRVAYRLARLDAGALTAFVRAALPAMTGPLVAGVGLVFLISLNDSVIPPLVLAHTWPSEVAPEVLDAALYGTPVAAILWKSWPILLTLVAAFAAALPGLRRLWERTERHEADELGSVRLGGGWAGAASVVAIAVVALLPVLVFVVDLYAARVGLGDAIRRAWTLYATERNASLIVAALSVPAALMIAIATLVDEPPGSPRRFMVGRADRAAANGGDEPRRSSTSRRIYSGGFGLSRLVLPALIGVALLPPELVAHVFVQVFNRPGVLGWMYDETPLVWLTALIARFGFVPVGLVWMAARQIPRDLLRQAATDGAAGPTLLAHVVVPMLARPLLAGALVFACLTLSEIAASFILIPIRFGGSLAVALDNQMHYGRNNDVIVTTLMLLVPAIVVSFLMPWVLKDSQRRPPPGFTDRQT